MKDARTTALKLSNRCEYVCKLLRAVVSLIFFFSIKLSDDLLESFRQTCEYPIINDNFSKLNQL